jgi:signal transduction histidine kinase
LTNVIGNALQYNRERGVVRITAKMDDSTAVVTVEDQGRGIASEDLPHVFKRFYRADKVRSRQADHSGLGLAIAHAIVTAHHGSIEVVSQVGSGSTFSIRLPRSIPPEQS